MPTLHPVYPSPLPDPLRLHTLKTITDVLDGITTANGYKHDLDGKVFRGRALFGEGDPIPMLSILEVPIPVDQLPSPGSESKGGWELMIKVLPRTTGITPRTRRTFSWQTSSSASGWRRKRRIGTNQSRESSALAGSSIRCISGQVLSGLPTKYRPKHISGLRSRWNLLKIWPILTTHETEAAMNEVSKWPTRTTH